MKTTTFAGLLASALHAQQAVATYSWGNAQQFSSPENCNNTCEGRQGGGWSFGDVPTTGNVGSFDGFGMSGFGCADSFGSSGGRRGLAKRFAQKALVGKATNDDASCPKISATDRDFSITQFHMSSDKEDQDVELHYDMPDGSVCKQKARCGTDARQFDNSQCGGAKQVRVRGDCSVAFHSFNFDCNPAPPSTSPPVSTTTRPPTTTTSQPPVTTTTSGCKENETPNTSGVCVPKTSSTTTASTTAPCKETETPNDKGSCVPKTSTTPVSTTPVTTSSAAPTCKGNEEFKDGKCVPKTPTGGLTTTTSSISGTPSPPPTEAGCPQVLPRCISTWIQKAGCSSNSDTSCICPKKELITNVQTCVEAWGGSATDIQAAYSFLVGLCAEFVPENPQICTGVPSTITLIPQPPPQTSVTGGTGAPAPTQPVNLPSTVITFTRTLSTNTLTQTVTVPQVSFNTITQQVPVTGGAAGPAGPTSGGVGLVPALPLTETATVPAGSPPTQTPVAGQTGASTFVPSTTTGIPATKTGNSPINSFTGAASRPAYAVAAGLLGVVAFLA